MLFPTKAAVSSTFRWLSATRQVLDERLAEQMFLAVKHFRFPKGGTYPTVFSDDELRQINLPTLLLIGDHEVTLHNGQNRIASCFTSRPKPCCLHKPLAPCPGDYAYPLRTGDDTWFPLAKPCQVPPW